MKFFVHKLGCPKNDVDADYISARLIDAGHEPAESPEEAESVIVNTCGFILPAKEESIEEIIRLGQLKKKGNLKTLYAAGCLTQKYGDEMLTEMNELDGTFGHGALDSIARAVTNSEKLDKTARIDTRKLGYLSWRDRYISDHLPFSYIKISDGCDRGCTYCSIPSMRGRFRSRPLNSILKEANYLADNGKKELILVSQEATIWGYDLKGKPTLIDMLEELDKIEKVKWIRPMYLYPAQLGDELIDYMASDNKTLNYFDLPLQHINDAMLSGMRRQVTREKIEHQIERIRSRSDDAVIRTTFITGFPGETEEQFEELRQFVAKTEFERMGVFTYSAEDGTPAADMEKQVPEDVKAERLDELMSVQREIAFDKNISLIGSKQEVIIDSPGDGQVAVGRSKGDCPDIDQEVFVSGRPLETGEIVSVEIESAEGYDLRGTVV